MPSLHRHRPHNAPDNQHADSRLDGINYLKMMAGPLDVIGDPPLVRRQPCARPFDFQERDAAVGVEDLKVRPASPRASY
jgi:hypothetical protein